MWYAGVAVLAVACVGIVLALGSSGDRLTGSNSVGVRADVAVLGPGERLCAPGPLIPTGTGAVRFAASWEGSAPGFVVEVNAGGARRVGSLASGAAPGTGRVDVPLDGTFAFDGEAAPGRVCLEPVGGSAAIGGMADLQADQRPASIDGSRLAARVALWYLAPEDERAGLGGWLGDAFERASLFRLGAVSPWWYPVGLFLVMPLLWLGALRLLATRAAGRLRPGRTAVAVAAIAFANAALWSIVTPAFQGPDEPEHFAFTQTLAATGEVPDKQPSERPPFATSLVVALDGVRAYSQVGLVGVRPPWLQADEDRWRDRLADTSGRDDDGGGFLFPASPHGPGYYGLTVPAYAAGEGGGVFAQLTLARLVSALLVALTAACAFLAVRELAPRLEWLAAAGGLLVAFHPQLAFLGGTVNSDNGVIAACALLVFLLLRGLRRGLSIPLAAGIGATLVAAHVMKGTGAGLYPAAAVAIVGMLVRRHRHQDLPAYGVLAGVALAVQGLWALLAPAFGTKPFTTPGGSAGPGLAGTVERVLEQLSTFGSYVWQFFLPRLPFMNDLHAQVWPAYDVYVIGGWAAFGWLTVRFPEWIYVVIAAISGVVGVLCAVAVARERLAARERGWEIATLLTVIASVLLGVAAVHFTPEVRAVPAEQGRYIFTAVVPLSAIAVGGTLAFGRRHGPVLAAVLVAAVAGLGYASQLLTLARFYG